MKIEVLRVKNSAIFRALFRGVSVLFIWLVVSASLFSVLYLVGLVPDYAEEFMLSALANNNRSAGISLPEFSQDDALLVIPKIDLIVPIVFPTSTDLAVLDKALLSGVVHYPESALPGENGNVYIFGHSTSRSFVKNKNFQAFNHLHRLEKGDEFFIRSKGVKYRYRVSSVEILEPDKNKIYLRSDKPKITLSTCWPLGNPLKRAVVEAEFVGSSYIN